MKGREGKGREEGGKVEKRERGRKEIKAMSTLTATPG